MISSRVFAALILAVTACDRFERGSAGGTRSEGGSDAAAYSSPGDVSLRASDGGGAVSSEQYRQWFAAHQGLDRRIASQFGRLLQPASPTERSIDKAVAYLSGEPRARDAIQRAGMSVREFVQTTVALEQEMRVASQTGMQPDTLRVGSVYPYPYPYPGDTTPVVPPSYPGTVPNPYPLPPPATPYPMTPTPYPTTSPAPTYTLPPPRDTTRRVDTVYVPQPVRRDTTPRDPLFWTRDTMPVRRDTGVARTRRDTLPRRDTLAIRRDSVIRPIIRDTIPRDTLRFSPR